MKVSDQVQGIIAQAAFLASDSMGPAVIMKYLLHFFEDLGQGIPREPYEGWLLVFGLFATVLVSVTARQFWFGLFALIHLTA